MFRKIRKFFLLPLICLAVTCGFLALAGAALGITSAHSDVWYGWALLGIAGAAYLLMAVVALPTVFTFVRWMFLKTFRSDDSHTWKLDRFYWVNLLFVSVSMPAPWVCLRYGWTASLIATGVAVALAIPLLLIKAKS